MTKSEVLARAQKMGLRGVMSDDSGLYTCNECGDQWQSGSRYVWWPIRKVGWHSRQSTPAKFFDWHAFQVGWDGIERRVFGQTFHVGRLFVAFGRDASPPPPDSTPAGEL